MDFLNFDYPCAKAGNHVRKPFIETIYDENNTPIGRNEYKVTEKIANGAYGQVFKVTRKNTFNASNNSNGITEEKDSVFAIKSLTYSDDEMPERIKYEMDLMCYLSHPNCISLESWFIDSDVSEEDSWLNEKHVCLVLPYFESNLLDLLDLYAPFSFEFIECILYQILDGLSYLHDEMCIIHRDLRPCNILINVSNKKCVIADLGVSKDVSILFQNRHNINNINSDPMNPMNNLNSMDAMDASKDVNDSNFSPENGLNANESKLNETEDLSVSMRDASSYPNGIVPPEPDDYHPDASLAHALKSPHADNTRQNQDSAQSADMMDTDAPHAGNTTNTSNAIDAADGSNGIHGTYGPLGADAAMGGMDEKGEDMEREDIKYTPQMYTVPYRAPELLLGSKTYDFAIDVWALGLMVTQMIHDEGKLLIVQQHDIQQLFSLFDLFGGPVGLEGVGYSSMLSFDSAPLTPLDQLFPYLKQSQGLTDLLTKLLVHNPKQRITATDAFRHEMFEKEKEWLREGRFDQIKIRNEDLGGMDGGTGNASNGTDRDSDEIDF